MTSVILLSIFLMQRRIHKVLIICSNYDNYMLEEDGRIDEQIFNEYVSLNLRYPPTFVQTDSVDEAMEILDNEKIDLVISMLNLTEYRYIFPIEKGLKINVRISRLLHLHIFQEKYHCASRRKI